MTPEGKVKAALKRSLAKIFGCYYFMPVQNGMGAPALDFYCCIWGHFVVFETKAPGKNLTPRQQHTVDAIQHAGGQVFVVHNQSEIDEAIACL